MAKGVSLQEAMSAQTVGRFEDKDIRRTSVEIPGVAGGLRKAMKIEPRMMAQGETGYIAIEYVVEKVRHEPIDSDAPAGDQERVHILRAVGSTFVDADLVREHVDATKAAIKKAEMEAKGVHELFEGGEQSPQAGDESGDKPKRSRARGPRKPKADQT